MTETITATNLDPRRVQPWNDVEDDDKLAALIESMAEHGWTGAPIIVINDGDGDPRAITGSHRIYAARETGIDVPAVDVEDLLAAAGIGLAELAEEYGNLGGDHYEAIVRLDYHLPADVVDYYGIDAH